MDPKSGKSVRMFNPFAIWTEIALKSGTAMLEAAQAAVTQSKAPRVAVLPDADAPAQKPAPKLSKSARKARKNASSRVRRRSR